MTFSQFYGMEGQPFPKGLPCDSLFKTEALEEVLSRLLYVAHKQRFGILTGECGSGKSTLMRMLAGSLDDRRYAFLYVADSKLTPRCLYNGLLEQLGQEGAFYRGDCMRKLHREIEALHGLRRKELVVVVDEAHLLDMELLQEVRFLLNFKMDSMSPMALILSGQPELEEKLSRRSSTAISQRVDVRCRLPLLGLAETGLYIGHHMALAGAAEPIFDESAVTEVFAYSGGSARLINKVCVACLLYGSTSELATLDGKLVKEIIDSELK